MRYLYEICNFAFTAMKKIVLLLLIIFFSGTSDAQKYFILEKTGSHRKMVFKTGGFINLYAANPGRRISGHLSLISDSLIVIDNWKPVKINDIVSVRINSFFSGKLTEFIFKATAGYFVVTTLNHIINHERIIQKTDMIITGSLLTGFGASLLYRSRSVKPGGRWVIKVMDEDFRY